MKKVLLSLLFAVGCATTSTEGPEPKFKVGECLTLNPTEVSKLDPTQVLVLSMTQLKLVDMGSTNYIIEVYAMGQLTNRVADKFAEVEKEFVVTSCEPKAVQAPAPVE